MRSENTRILAKPRAGWRVLPLMPDYEAARAAFSWEAIHVHGAVLAHHVTGTLALDLHPEDVFWCTADPGWVTGTSYGILSPLTHGVTGSSPSPFPSRITDGSPRSTPASTTSRGSWPSRGVEPGGLDMKKTGLGAGQLEEAWREVWRDRGARWPGVLIGLGASAAALSLNARPAKRGVSRVLQRLSILGAAFSWVNLYLIRPWQLHWGATWEEVHRAMRGDALVPHPLMEATRAISIEAPPSAVWPWVVVTGPKGGFTVEGLEPERCLELVIRDRGRPLISSVLLLEPLGVRRTRLVSRVRMRLSLHPEALLLYLAMDFGELLMTRKRMRGIKARAERNPVPPPSLRVPSSEGAGWNMAAVEGP